MWRGQIHRLESFSAGWFRLGGDDDAHINMYHVFMYDPNPGDVRCGT